MTQCGMWEAEHVEVADSSDDRYTPQEVLDCLAELWPKGIGLDPCWNPRSLVKARWTMTAADDCLTCSWPMADTIFMNPPWSGPDPFLRRLRHQLSVTEASAVTVTKLDTSTAWWRDNLWHASRICFPGRLRFMLPTGERMGTPAFESAIAYFGDDDERFSAVFSPLGRVLRP